MSKRGISYSQYVIRLFGLAINHRRVSSATETTRGRIVFTHKFYGAAAPSLILSNDSSRLRRGAFRVVSLAVGTTLAAASLTLVSLTLESSSNSASAAPGTPGTPQVGSQTYAEGFENKSS